MPLDLTASARVQCTVLLQGKKPQAQIRQFTAHSHCQAPPVLTFVRWQCLTSKCIVIAKTKSSYVRMAARLAYWQAAT